MIAPLALAAAAAVPQPEALDVYKDWTIGCDNVRSCKAVGLASAEGNPSSDSLRLAILREGAPRNPPRLTVNWDTVKSGERWTLTLDGSAFVSGVATADDNAGEVPLTRAQATHLANAKSAAVGGATASLAGLAAALRRMDERQRRAGTTEGILAVGTGAVPVPPALPVVVRAAVAGKPRAVRKATIDALRRAAKCEIAEVGGPDSADVSRIDARTDLMLLSCGSGAYNASTIPYISTGGAWTLAPFDRRPSWGEDGGPPALVNASWDDRTRTLTSYAKGRGLGDCGVSQNFVWDGRRLRLVEQTEMGECRGSIDWITTFRAAVR